MPGSPDPSSGKAPLTLSECFKLMKTGDKVLRILGLGA
jgi:hypothetical protein